jgi:hypothetical protein
MDKTQNIWTYRNDAKWRLNRAAELGGCHATELLKSGARSPIIKSLTAPDVARNVFGMRQASMQDRWRALVGLAADNPYALGFRNVDGGLRGLADDMNTCLDADSSFTTLSRNLNEWSTRQPPLVLTGHGKRTRARAPLDLIHIPLLTRWLLWTAEARANVFAQAPRVIDLNTICEVACRLIPLGTPPPSSTLERSEANRLLRNADRRAR